MQLTVWLDDVHVHYNFPSVLFIPFWYSDNAHTESKMHVSRFVLFDP